MASKGLGVVVHQCILQSSELWLPPLLLSLELGQFRVSVSVSVLAEVSPEDLS